jgi:hypothetical protein
LPRLTVFSLPLRLIHFAAVVVQEPGEEVVQHQGKVP